MYGHGLLARSLARSPLSLSGNGVSPRIESGKAAATDAEFYGPAGFCVPSDRATATGAAAAFGSSEEGKDKQPTCHESGAERSGADVA